MENKPVKIIALLATALTMLSLSACSNVNLKTPEWEAAADVYRLYIQTPASQLALDKEEELSNTFETLLSELEQNNDFFIIDSSRYYELDGKKMYEHNKAGMQEMGTDFDENIDPNGKSITVSVSYFKVNPIETVNGTPIESCLKEDENTLNILVPVKYKDREEEIIALYKSFFFFQKISVGNIYNEDAGRPLNSILESDLNVNIIYVNDDQNYFTFNPTVVKENNNLIVDPMVIIYDYNVHSSYAYSYAGTGSFYRAGSSDQEALAKIWPVIESIDGMDEYILGVRLASKHYLPWGK